MSANTGNQLDSAAHDVARRIATDIAPDEAAMFDEFVNERMGRGRTRVDDPFAFGLAEVMPFVTPRILEACHLVGLAIVAGTASVTKDVAKDVAKDLAKDKLKTWLQHVGNKRAAATPQANAALGDECVHIASAQLQLSGMESARADELGAVIVASMRIALASTHPSS